MNFGKLRSPVLFL